jgi:hypothetical protein
MNVTAPSTWQDVIRDLQRVGYTYNRIAIECQLRGVEYTMEAVAALARGRKREPHWSPGNVIMQLHIKHCQTTARSE